MEARLLGATGGLGLFARRRSSVAVAAAAAAVSSSSGIRMGKGSVVNQRLQGHWQLDQRRRPVLESATGRAIISAVVASVAEGKQIITVIDTM